MRHALLGARPLLDLQHLCASRPNREHALALANLHVFARQLQLAWQAIEHPIVRDIAVPGHFSLFSGKALPGKVLGQGQRQLLSEPLSRTYMSRAMDAAI